MQKVLRKLTLVALVFKLILLAPGLVWSAAPPLSTITGTVYNVDGTLAANTAVVFDSLFTQVVGANTINKTRITATTSSLGVLPSTTIPQSLFVSITVGSGLPANVTIPSTTSTTLDSLLGTSQNPPAAAAISSITIGAGGDYNLNVVNPTSGFGAATLTPGAVNHFTLTSNASAGNFKLQSLVAPGAIGDALSEGRAIGAVSAAAGTFSALTVNTSIAGTGGGLKHQRVAGCTTPATQFSLCDTTITWTSAFVDTNYTVVGDCGAVVTNTPFHVKTYSQTTTTVTLTTGALTAAAASCSVQSAIAMHD